MWKRDENSRAVDGGLYVCMYMLCSERVNFFLQVTCAMSYPQKSSFASTCLFNFNLSRFETKVWITISAMWNTRWRSIIKMCQLSNHLPSGLHFQYDSIIMPTKRMFKAPCIKWNTQQSISLQCIRFALLHTNTYTLIWPRFFLLSLYLFFSHSI